MLNRLKEARELDIREEQAGFRPGRGCIDQIFSLRQILEHRHAYRQPTIAVFLDFRGAFDSVDRSSLFEILHRRGMPQKFVNIIKAMYSYTTGSVRAYGSYPVRFLRLVEFIRAALYPHFYLIL